jgi:hypothetical protein
VDLQSKLNQITLPSSMETQPRRVGPGCSYRYMRAGSHPINTYYWLDQASRDLAIGLAVMATLSAKCDYLLVEVPDLEPDDGLEEPRAVVAAGDVGVPEHLLRHLPVELG